MSLLSSSREPNRSRADFIEIPELCKRAQGLAVGNARRPTGQREGRAVPARRCYPRGRHQRLDPRAKRLIRPADQLRIEAPFRDRIFHGRVWHEGLRGSLRQLKRKRHDAECGLPLRVNDWPAQRGIQGCASHFGLATGQPLRNAYGRGLFTNRFFIASGAMSRVAPKDAVAVVAARTAHASQGAWS